MAKNQRDYVSMVTIYGAGLMSKEEREKIASWLNRTADDFIREGDNYTEGRFVARKMK